jgi:predicted ATPase
MAATAKSTQCGELFVGRGSSLSALARLLDRGPALVTVTGVAGVGKSALIRVAVARHRHAHGAGAVLACDLGSAAGVTEVTAAVARAAGVRLPPADDAGLLEHVARALGALGPALLVLDDVEVVIDAVATAVDLWTARAPELTVLVGTRQRLRLPHEQVIELAPLALPELEAPSERCEAMEMWCALARRAGRPTPATDLGTVARLLHAIDGLPLAIELAAAQCDVLAPAQLVARLGSERARLTSPLRSTSTRHRSLDHALAASWHGLSDDERRTLAQCAVFRGGFTLEAAEAVVAPSRRGAAAVVDTLRALRDRSLLWIRPGRRGPRFGMYRAVRDFAADRLVALRLEAAAVVRHAVWFARPAEDGAISAPQAGADIDDEENVRAAIERCASGAPFPRARGRHLALALLTRWGLGVLPPGYLPWCSARLDEALAARSSAGPILRARGLLLRGLIATRLVGPRRGVADFEAAARLARRAGAAPVTARALALVGQARAALGERAAGRRMAEQSVELARQCGNTWVEANALLALGWIARREGASPGLDDVLAGAVELFRRSGDRHGELRAQIERASGLIERGDLVSAARTVEAARRLVDPAEHANGAMLGLMEGLARQGQGALDAALASFEGACTAARRAGDDQALALVEGYLGLLRLERGDLDDASRTLRGAAEAVGRLGDPIHRALFLTAAAAAEAATLHTEPAARVMRRAATTKSEGAFQAVLELGRAAVELGRARQCAVEAGRTAGSPEARWDAAEQRIEAATQRAPTAGPWSFECSVLVRHLRAEVDRGVVRRGARPTTTQLAIGEGCSWFRPPGGARVDIGNRPVMRRILDALARAHGEHPGAALGAGLLQAAGWPDERMLARSGRTRVKVMMARMRELGLRSLLCSAPEGYFLDPAAVVVIGEPAAVPVDVRTATR